MCKAASKCLPLPAVAGFSMFCVVRPIQVGRTLECPESRAFKGAMLRRFSVLSVRYKTSRRDYADPSFLADFWGLRSF
jgi:hypothetical protein